MNKHLATIPAAVGSVVLFGTDAFAASPATIPADPTAGAMASTQDSVVTWVTTYGVPVLFGLIGMGILIRLGVRWAKKAGRSV